MTRSRKPKRRTDAVERHIAHALHVIRNTSDTRSITVVYLAKDQLSKLPCKGPVTFVTGATRFCVQAPTDTCHMICGTRSIRVLCDLGGIGGRGQNCCNMRKKKERHGANSKDYLFPISTECLRPFSTQRRRLGRKRPEKRSFCWISGCASICDLTCAISS